MVYVWLHDLHQTAFEGVSSIVQDVLGFSQGTQTFDIFAYQLGIALPMINYQDSRILGKTLIILGPFHFLTSVSH